MATGVIKTTQALSAGTITKYNESLSGTLDTRTCYKVGDIVTVASRIHTMADEVANGNLFQISEGFRPRTTTTVMGYLFLSGQTMPVPTFLTVYNSGIVALNYSSSMHMTQIGFCGTYHT